MNRVDRLLGYLLTFQGRSLVRAQDLAEKFEVSERTVYRDIDALCEVGVPLYGTPGEGYRLMDGYYLPPIMFSEHEARALYLAVSILVGFSEAGPTQDAAHAALEKIRVVLPKATLEQVEALQATWGFYKFGHPLFNLDDERIVQIQRAIQQQHLIHISYHAMHSNAVNARDIEPLHLAFVDNVWIVHGYCRLRTDFRNFRLDRIDSLRILPQTFEPRAVRFGSHEQGEVLVEVRFRQSVVRWVREVQHITFISERECPQTGQPILCYRVSNQGQMVRWLLGWGDQFEVVAPDAIRTEVARIAGNMVQNHATTGKPAAHDHLVFEA